VAVPKQEEQLGLAEGVVAAALRKGADEAEAFVYQGLTTSVSIERGQIARSSRIVDKGLGVRVVKGKAVGFSYTNVLEGKSATEETILKAQNLAKASKPDPDWAGLPSGKPPAFVEDTYDVRIVRISPEDLVETASIMLGAAEEADKRAFAVGGDVGISHLSNAIANSSGVASFEEGTVAECSLATVAKEGSDITPVCFEFANERKFDIDAERVGREAAKLAASALKAKTMATKNTNVIFTQFALQQLFRFTLINAIRADYVQRNQSAFKGKAGERVASEILTIHDDGLLRGGIRTARFDGEGVPQQKTPIIEKGVLRNFIFDNYAARKEGRESTGNASRAGYLSTPSVDATNFRIMPASASPEDLVGGVKEGLIVHSLQGAHSSNPASGEFSIVATPAWKIEKGEISHAAKAVMLAGDAFQVLSDISGLANNERKVGQLVAPWVLVENVKVIGK
jgi:PmbA protein